MNETPRFPAIADDKLTELQRLAVDEMKAGPRGAIGGPFVPLLHAPELARRLQRVGEYLRFQTRLPLDVIELVVLMTARKWNCDFEWWAHARIALEKTTLPAAVIEQVKARAAPDALTQAQRLAYAFCTQVHDAGVVSDATFAATGDAFGLDGALELLALCGYYSTLAMILNVAKVLPPEGPVLGA